VCKLLANFGCESERMTKFQVKTCILMKIVNCEIGGEIVYFVVKIKIKIVKHFFVFLGDPPQNPLFFYDR
jgi:hypothetical protein